MGGGCCLSGAHKAAEPGELRRGGAAALPSAGGSAGGRARPLRGPPLNLRHRAHPSLSAPSGPARTGGERRGQRRRGGGGCGGSRPKAAGMAAPRPAPSGPRSASCLRRATERTRGAAAALRRAEPEPGTPLDTPSRPSYTLIFKLLQPHLGFFCHLVSVRSPPPSKPSSPLKLSPGV